MGWTMMESFKDWYKTRYGMTYPTAPGAHEVASDVFARIAEGVAEYMDLWLSIITAQSVPVLVAALPPGEKIIAMTVWQDMVVLATSTGVYLMRTQAEGFLPAKIEKAPAEAAEPNEAGITLRRHAGFHRHWVNELTDNRVARALALGFRYCVYENGTGPVRRCVGNSPGRVPLYAIALEIENERWPEVMEELEKW